jgi:predicted component of type VI protein secretion system
MDSMTPQEKALIHELLEDMRHIRNRLDRHVDDEAKVLSSIQKDIGKIREEMAGHKTRLGVIASGISLVMAAAVSWLVSHLGAKP